MLVKRNPPIGARPGTLAIPAGSPPPQIHLFDYGPEQVVERSIEDFTGLEQFAQTDTTTWNDVRGMGDETALRRIGEIFDIHPLALEDAVNVPQRAKSELYEGHQVVIARAPLVVDGRLEVPQVCLVLGPRYLITFQERYFGFFDPVRDRIRAGIGPMRRSGPDYLAYALVDIFSDVPTTPADARSRDDGLVQFEFGLTLGMTEQLHLWRIPLPRIGIGYRFGEDLTVYRLVFGSPY